MPEIVASRNRTLTDGRKKLVGYVLVGYPDCDSFFSVLDCCNRSSLDVLELGFPSRNPYSDGEVIAKAHLSVDHEKACSLEYWKEVRSRTEKPIWLMAYRSDFIGSGVYRDFAASGVLDAVVIPDMTNEERMKLAEEMKPYGVDVVNFVNPGMSIGESDIVFSEGGLVYEQLYVGQTGSSSQSDEYLKMLGESLKYPGVTSFAGFGISTPEQVVSKYRNGFDGVIIGTAILKHLNVSLESMNQYLGEIGRAKELWH